MPSAPVPRPGPTWLTPEKCSRELTYILRRMYEEEAKGVDELAALINGSPRRWPGLAHRLRERGAAGALVEVAECSVRDGRCRFIHDPQAATLRAAPRGRGPPGGPPGLPRADLKRVVLTVGLRHCSMPQLRLLEGGRLGETEQNLLRAELCGQGWDASAALVFDVRYLHDRFHRIDTCHCGLYPPTMENILEAHQDCLLADLEAIADRAPAMSVIVCKSGKHRAPAAGAMLAHVLEGRGVAVGIYHASAKYWSCDCCWRDPRGVSPRVAVALEGV